MEKVAMTAPTAASAETDRVREFYEGEAPRYDLTIAVFERLLFAGGRRWVCSRARGDTLELAVGTGRNLSEYPAGVRLTGIELSPAMLAIARRRAAQVNLDADLRLGAAQQLDFPDASFDTVTCTLSLCTIPDDRAAVAEVRRVLRPGGRFVLLEHVRSNRPVIRAAERALDPLAVRFQADHLAREPLEHLVAEGFAIEELERSKLGIVERVAARTPA
jgi:ubiquinone/menaquinone biosynthesis C-methylase UbiE